MLKRIFISLFSSLLLSLFLLNLSFGEEDNNKKLTEAEREKVHQTMELYGNNISKALNAPNEMIVEPLLSAVEKRNTIELNRNSMMKTHLCIADLMHSAPHLAKISTGNNVIKAKVEIDSGSRKTSMYTRWEKRNLEDTVLKFTLFYDSDDVSPTEFICSGHGYY